MGNSEWVSVISFFICIMNCVFAYRMNEINATCTLFECMIVLAPGTYEIEIHRVHELEI